MVRLNYYSVTYKITILICDCMDLGIKSNSIILLQLKTTLMYHACTVLVPGLVDWSAFYSKFCHLYEATPESMGLIEGT